MCDDGKPFLAGPLLPKLALHNAQKHLHIARCGICAALQRKIFSFSLPSLQTFYLFYLINLLETAALAHTTVAQLIRSWFVLTSMTGCGRCQLSCDSRTTYRGHSIRCPQLLAATDKPYRLLCTFTLSMDNL